MNARNILAVVAIILVGLLGWMWTKNSGLNSAIGNLETEKTNLTNKIGDFEKIKTDLDEEVTKLELTLNELTEENAELAASVQDEKSRVSRRNATIKKLKAAKELSASENSSLQDQISGLLAAKKELEMNIENLRTENTELKEQLGIVQENLTKAQDDNAALDKLNKTMQSEISNLTLKNFKATAFQVEIEKKRKSKVTSKSRWAKKIKATFDLVNVPEKYQGVRPLYMVITDETSNPIYLENPINVTVNVNGQPSQIIAAEKKEINIDESQRISFSHRLGKRLKKGYYRIIIYTDIGILGANTFRLR